MHVGVAHHLGWAVVVTASPAPALSPSPEVVDRRRVELVEPGVPSAPIHHEGGTWAMHGAGTPPDDEALGALVEQVRASVRRCSAAALDEIAATVGSPIRSLSVRAWPEDLSTDIAVLRRPPLESRVDSYMYCRELAAEAMSRGWAVHRYAPGDVERLAADALGPRAAEVLDGQRARLGPPWSKDHRLAFAAAVVACYVHK